jgi:IclR family mhp operon transcriptional activator
MKAPSNSRLAARPTEAGPIAERYGRIPPKRGEAVYKDVRSLSRGLAIIEALGSFGWIKLGQLSTHTGIDRTTVYRLVNTLADDGYVTRRREDGAVGLSNKLLNISQNLRSNDLAAQIVFRHLKALTQLIKWPSDFAVLSQGALRIAASTHGDSPMSIHRAMVGNTRPLFRSALGKAYLAALPEDELAEILELARTWDGVDAADARATEKIKRALEDVRVAGYASAVGTTESKISAIALPVHQSGTVVGSVNVIFLRRAMAGGEAAERYLSKLRATVAAIEEELAGSILA